MATRYGSATVTLPSDTEILITRDFEASRELLWEVLTTPEHVLRWWGPSWHPIVACEIDLRVGGSWRYTSRGEDGEELTWRGVYQQIDAPERLVTTEVFDPSPDSEALSITTLTETRGLTRLEILVQHTSREHRDGHVHSGMEKGLQETYQRLDDFLAVIDSPSERFRRVSARFGARVAKVPDQAWDNASPCDDWTARDVLVHLLTWVPALLSRGGLEFRQRNAPDEDPVAAWADFTSTIQRALDTPHLAQHTFEVGPPGTMSLQDTVDMLVTPDVLIHTWDLARATGLDERLDERIAAQTLTGMQPMDEALRASGHYGPRVEVPAEADIQTRLLAFTGRQP